MIGAADPWAFRLHPVVWTTVIVVASAVVLAHRRLSRQEAPPVAWPRRQQLQAAGACALLLLALTWPVADLATHWSLTALVVQRQLLVLGVAPLLLLGLPYDVLRRITRPAPIDAFLTWLRRPAAAIGTVTALLVGTMLSPVVVAQASSLPARVGADAAVLVAGIALWLPVVGRVPGIPRLRPVLRFGYLIGQAVVPAFLSFILIFSTHPLFSVYAGSARAVHLRPLADQQVAGFVSKLSMLLVLLIVGAVVLARAPVDDGEFGGDDPLVWADVERHFERVDRRGEPIPRESAPAASDDRDEATGRGAGPVDPVDPSDPGPGATG